MMDRIKHHELFLLFAAFLVCPSVGATTFAHMSVAEMSRASSAIVRARCVTNTVGWEAGEIWTFTAFEVEETWRGETPSRITVRLLGGRLGSVTSSVSGVPRFRMGEEVVLFLEPAPNGNFSIVSWEQGTFRIRHEIRTNEEVITQDTASFATFDPATRQFETNGIRNQPVRELRAQVEAAFARGVGRKP
jgi:hypothetical protein